MPLSRITLAAAAAALSLTAAAASAAEVQISGIIAEGVYYTNPKNGDDAFKMAGYKETP